MPARSATRATNASRSASSTASTAPPEARAAARTSGPSGGSPMASTPTRVVGPDRRDVVGTGRPGRRDRGAARGLAHDEPGPGPVGGEGPRHLEGQRARGHGQDDLGGWTGLLDDLVGDRARAGAVPGPQVAVDPAPVAQLLRALRGDPVGGVVVASDDDDRRPLGHQRVPLARRARPRARRPPPEARLGGADGDGAGEVAGRRAGQHGDAESPGPDGRGRDDPVLERAGGVGGLVLEPEVGEAERRAQLRGGDERGRRHDRALPVA